MPRIIYPLICILWFSFIQAQETTLEEIPQLELELSLSDVDSNSVADEELTDLPVFESIKDSILFIFKQHHQVSEIDSLWKKELFNTELFEEMQASVENFEPESKDTIVYNELSTETLINHLEILNAKTPFDVSYTVALENTIKRYLKTRKKSMQRLMNLSNYYFPMFEEELDRHNLPLELKYLAIVESALNPRAKSRVGATGLWQFMYPTGKMFGMEVSSYVDERSDPLRATESAAKYLSSLHSVFNDWDLALAAYNAGPGNVSRAMRRSGGKKNYWEIRPNLPRETAGYVPAFLATMYIFEFAEEHGFSVPKSGLPYYKTDTVHIKQSISFQHLSELLEVPVEELQFLNPSYKLDIIPFIEGKQYTLRLPMDVLGTFVSNEDLVYAYAKTESEKNKKPLPEFFKQDEQITYRVKSGDYLGKIASSYGVSVRNIKSWNGMRNNNLRIGQRLIIYPKGKKTSSSSAKTTSKPNQTSEYVVQKGDSLWSISRKFPGVSIDNIKKWNGISGTSLKPGMKLKLSNG